MKLGEQIYEFRKERNLSQGDLADKLGVSRQSISKWENNLAMPELDKIVMLSEIFDVSIDRFLKGDAVAVTEEKAETMENDMQESENRVRTKRNNIVGIALLSICGLALLILTVLGGLGGLLTGGAIIIPIVIIAIIYLKLRENEGLYSLWTVLMYLDLVTPFFTGISRHLVRYTFSRDVIINPTVLIMSWIYLLFTIFVIAYSFKVYINRAINNETKFKNRAITVLIILILSIVCTVINNHFIFSYLIDSRNYILASILSCIFTEINFISLWTLVISLVRYLKYKK